jgi:hypothetical protein
LWSSFSDLCEFLSLSSTSAEITAISLSVDELYLHGELWQDGLSSAVPKSPPAGWSLLGFDVADSSFLSGLANCGYTDHLVLLEARKNWANRLNEWHLFQEEDAARSFREEVDIRVPEHAPFFVFGLWVLVG